MLPYPTGAYKGLVILLGLFYILSPPVYSFGGQGIKPIMKPQLVQLKAYDSTQDISNWLMSEKLDGIRAYWDGRRLISRSGKAFSVPVWFTKNFPPFELDGELWLGRNQFSETISIVNKQMPHNQWSKVTYQVFEVPNQAGGLLDRLKVLNLYLEHFSAPYLRIVKQVRIDNHENVASELKRITALQGEGLVLRDAESLYYSGRTSHALKVKLKEDAECIIQGTTAGKGKYLGMVGALQCKLLEGEFTNVKDVARIIKLGSGLTDKQRASPPKVGSKVTFQYMGLTQSGLPRFPVYLRLKELSLEP